MNAGNRSFSSMYSSATHATHSLICSSKPALQPFCQITASTADRYPVNGEGDMSARSHTIRTPVIICRQIRHHSVIFHQRNGMRRFAHRVFSQFSIISTFGVRASSTSYISHSHPNSDRRGSATVRSGNAINRLST